MPKTVDFHLYVHARLCAGIWYKCFVFAGNWIMDIRWMDEWVGGWIWRWMDEQRVWMDYVNDNADVISVVNILFLLIFLKAKIFPTRQPLYKVADTPFHIHTKGTIG